MMLTHRTRRFKRGHKIGTIELQTCFQYQTFAQMFSKYSDSAGPESTPLNRPAENPDVQTFSSPVSGIPSDRAAVGVASADVMREMSRYERATLRWARIAVVMSGAAALFVGFQWHEMHSGSADTHELALAAKEQASGSKEIAERTRDLATEMHDQADRTKALASEMQRQANLTATIAKEAVEQASRLLKNALRGGLCGAKDPGTVLRGFENEAKYRIWWAFDVRKGL